LGPIARGALELSNVDPVKEMVSLLEVKGAYSASLNAIHTADEMAGEANNLIRRS
jgi:flagellar basal body rod protein FlgG